VKLTGNFKKAAYVTALGKYASEGYWANFFYQSHGSRRELLIEALMGRSNAEIRSIKESFKDKRYGDDLKGCMEQELKMDKFRTAVLMTIEARRQEENDPYPPEYLHRDVDTLYRAIHTDRGGESTILEIVVRRSDTHLREVLRAYERTFHSNFARAALEKSNNLVVSGRADLNPQTPAWLTVPLRAKWWPISSTASSTNPRATPCYSTTPSVTFRRRAKMSCATNSSSRASSACTGIGHISIG
jgi:hypothetical protein